MKAVSTSLMAGRTENTTMLTTNFSTRIVEPRGVVAITISGFFLFVILLLAIFGNMVVFLAVVKTRRLWRERENIFIVNLSITDMLSAVIVMISSFVSLVQDQQPSELNGFWCNVVCASNYCFIIVSMLTLMWISFDRYQAIMHTMEYETRITRKRIYGMIIYSWFQGMVFAVIPVAYNWIEYDYWEVVCAVGWSHHMPQSLIYVIVAFTLCFLVPSFVLLYCYFQIMRKVAKMKIAPTASTTNGVSSGVIRQPNHNQNINKAVRSLLIVLVAFFICMTPFCVTKLLKVIFPNPDHNPDNDFVPKYANLAASWIGYCSSAINPLIYGIFRKDFRMAFLITFHRILCPSKSLETSFNMDTLNQYYT